jgi:hypothetical protein
MLRYISNDRAALLRLLVLSGRSRLRPEWLDVCGTRARLIRRAARTATTRPGKGGNAFRAF